MSHNAPGKAAACLAVLSEGSATTGEVAAETGLPAKLAGTHLRNLYLLGKLTREAHTKPVEPGRSGPRRCWMWSLKVAA